MDISSVATGLAAGASTDAVGTGILKSVQNLEGNVVNRLFAQIGIGQNVDTYA